jgi:hypothetical protein
MMRLMMLGLGRGVVSQWLTNHLLINNLSFNFFSVTFHPDRDDPRGNTHGSKHASTIHRDENDHFGFGNVESDAEEEEDEWNDEAETTRCQPTRFSEAMAIEVRSSQVEES